MPISQRPSRREPGSGRDRPSRTAPRPRAGRRRGCGWRTGCRSRGRSPARCGSAARSDRARSDRELVDRRLEREHAGALARRAHPRRRGHVERDEPVRRPPVRRRVHHPRRDRGLLGELLDRRRLLDDVVRDRRQPAVAAGAELEALDRRRAVAGEREHLLPRDGELDRPAERAARTSPRARRAGAASPSSRSRRRRAARSRAPARARARTSSRWSAPFARRPGSSRTASARRPPRPRSWRAAPSGCCARRASRRSRRRSTSAAASAPSTSPVLGVGRIVRVHLVGLVQPRDGRREARRRAPRSSYSTRTSSRGLREPSRGCRRRRPRRSARGRRPRSTAAPPARRPRRGRPRAFSCESTASTPSSASAPAASTARIGALGDRRLDDRRVRGALRLGTRRRTCASPVTLSRPSIRSTGAPTERVRTLTPRAPAACARACCARAATL